MRNKQKREYWAHYNKNHTHCCHFTVFNSSRYTHHLPLSLSLSLSPSLSLSLSLIFISAQTKTTTAPQPQKKRKIYTWYSSRSSSTKSVLSFSSLLFYPFSLLLYCTAVVASFDFSTHGGEAETLLKSPRVMWQVSSFYPRLFRTDSSVAVQQQPYQQYFYTLWLAPAETRSFCVEGGINL